MSGNGLGSLSRILVVRLDNIGDLVMMTPALRAIHKSYPQARIGLLASPGASQISAMLPWVDEVIPWKTVWQEIHPGLEETAAQAHRLEQTLRLLNFDAALIFTSFTQSPYPPAFSAFLAGIPIRAGQSKEFGGQLLTHWFRPGEDKRHQVDRNLDLLAHLDIPLDGSDLELWVTEAGRQQAKEFLDQRGVVTGEPYLVAAPGASCSTRRYSADRFALVVAELSRLIDLPIFIVGTHKEARIFSAMTAGMDQRRSRVFPLFGMTGLEGLAGLIETASLVLATNSAPMHIADAFRVPQVILYSGSETRSQWEPRTSNAILLQREVSCSPCFLFDCPKNMECLDVPIEEVVQAVTGQLGRSLAASYASREARKPQEI